MYYFVIFFSVSLLSLGLILLKKPFFSFAIATTGLLDSMLDSSSDEMVKQKNMIRKLTALLSKFGLFLLILFGIIIVSLVPIKVYMYVKAITLEGLDTSSFYFYLSMILGSVILFVFPSKKNKNKDYTDWSILLHKMVLDNYNLSKFLFNLEKRFFKKKLKKADQDFVIVTGLARGGTTALTNLLFETDKFHSLSYSNMPFLLSPNIWNKLYKPKKNKLKQRAHGDNIMFGYKTIEALEEYFYKAFLDDGFISDQVLELHDIDESTYEAYAAYQKLINFSGKDSTYLAKNNNLILRYKSIRKFNPDFKIVMIFRDPVEHAYSLLNQHMRFSKTHSEDPFTLEYMNWLGHHEFGLNHKPFNLELIEERTKYKDNEVNYWLAVWISYYNYILTFPEDKNLFLFDYTDLCTQPARLILTLSIKIGIDISVKEREPYKKTQLPPDLAIDKELQDKANEIYQKLIDKKVFI